MLTQAGRDQALKVSSALAGMTFDAIYSSPLQRASETTELIVDALKTTSADIPTPQFTDRLKEINLPLWEGITFEEAKANFPQAYDDWRNRPQDFCMQLPKGEGFEAFFPVRSLYQQAQDFWRTLLSAHVGQTILVVAHSAINRALLSTAIGLGPEKFTSLQQSNCAISVLNFANGWEEPAQIESINLTDHMGEPVPPMRKAYKGPRLLLVRHGETEWNRQQRFQGRIDIPLNENGRVQGAKAAALLKTVPIDTAVSSPLLRPKETAEMILQHHPAAPLTLESNLQEISHGEWEGKFAAEIEQDYPGLLQQWQQAPETVQMPGGENLQQVWDRAIAAWEEIVAANSGFETPQTILVAAHDAINKAILCYVTGLGPEHFWCFKQGNGAVSVIDYPNGAQSAPVLTAMNITTHLSEGILDRTAAGAL